MENYLERNVYILRECCLSIKEYTKYGDEIVNKGLRTDNLSEQGFRIYNNLMNAFSQVIPTTEKITVYRGMRHYGVDINVGDIIHEKGFSSFSLKERIAIGFSMDNEDTIGYVLRLHIPKGRRILYLNSIELSKHPEEEEILLEPGLRFEIVSVSSYNIDNGRPQDLDIKIINRGFVTPIVNPEIDKEFNRILSMIRSDDYVYIYDHHKLISDHLGNMTGLWMLGNFRSIISKDKINKKLPDMYKDFIIGKFSLYRTNIINLPAKAMVTIESNESLIEKEMVNLVMIMHLSLHTLKKIDDLEIIYEKIL